MFSHYGYLKCLWDVVIIIATIYVALIVPYNAAFYRGATAEDLSLGLGDSRQCPGGERFPLIRYIQFNFLDN